MSIDLSVNPYERITIHCLTSVIGRNDETLRPAREEKLALPRELQSSDLMDTDAQFLYFFITSSVCFFFVFACIDIVIAA